MTKAEYKAFLNRGIPKGTDNLFRRWVYPCREITIHSPVDQDQFFGKKFCGKRDGAPFISAKRPQPTGRIGPADYACP